jgi:hypothetical protein
MDEACITTNCGAEQAACFPPGTLSCGEVLTCIEGCTDQYCGIECQLDGSEEAAMMLFAFAECINTNQCTSFDCPECATERAACN